MFLIVVVTDLWNLFSRTGFTPSDPCTVSVYVKLQVSSGVKTGRQNEKRGHVARKVDSSAPGGSQRGLSVVTGSQGPHNPMETLIYIWDASGAELSTWSLFTPTLRHHSPLTRCTDVQCQHGLTLPVYAVISSNDRGSQQAHPHEVTLNPLDPPSVGRGARLPVLDQRRLPLPRRTTNKGRHAPPVGARRATSTARRRRPFRSRSASPTLPTLRPPPPRRCAAHANAPPPPAWPQVARAHLLSTW